MKGVLSLNGLKTTDLGIYAETNTMGSWSQSELPAATVMYYTHTHTYTNIHIYARVCIVYIVV